MATLSKGKTFGATEQVTAAKLHSLIDDGSVSAIVNADIDANAAIADTKLAQISTANKVKAGAVTDEDLNVADLTCDDVTCDSVSVNANGKIFLVEGTVPSTAANGGALYTKDTGGQPELFYREESDGDEVQITSSGVLNSGSIVQVVNYQTGTYATGSTQIPEDNTIPQSAEGDQYMSLAVTPTNASNKLKIEVTWIGGCADTQGFCVALFQDSTAGALACAVGRAAGIDQPTTVSFIHYMTAGTTNTTTFKVRAGASTGSTALWFNGQQISGSPGGVYGGVLASSITITEIVP